MAIATPDHTVILSRPKASPLPLGR